MGKVMEQLKIADAMAKKVILKPALDGGVQLVAAVGRRKSVSIRRARSLALKILTIVGPLPAEINLNRVPRVGASAARRHRTPRRPS